ncbi:pantoate--beta-alanine ligase [Bacillus sp. JCM 19034]|uniref:pantoate--beta-alanine ligase n=1 Tax=Bacillus sp. JCM 19034 TaxID=1481928 RepID=UPI0007838EAB|nr:pantoate--beta-alanine ligase [Bacillus sp. JCM 19034]
MKVIKTIPLLKEEIKKIQQSNETIGFVPTMGYLHEGHLSLIEEARNQTNKVILSIFVNPLQFGENEDLDQYPRDFKRDEQLARLAGVDILFYPDIAEMYPSEIPMMIHVSKGVDVLCGKSRPGHFDGVATVVMKLFNIVQPTKAFFGQKDAQQVAVIINMVNAFNIPVEIVRCPTIREEDGLAKSSRNVYLTNEERKEAPIIYNSLLRASHAINEGMRKKSDVIKLIKDHLSQGNGKIDYVDVLTYPALEDKGIVSGQVIIAVAYKYKKARLIDNYIMTVKERD